MTNALAIREFTSAELNLATPFNEAVIAAGLAAEDIVFIGSPYTILKGKEKDALLEKPFFIRGIRFAVDQTTERPYVVLYAVANDDSMYILTDGSTGIYRQIEAVVETRHASNHPTPEQNFLIANGLRKSEYGITADGKIAQPDDKIDSMATTYYLA